MKSLFTHSMHGLLAVMLISSAQANELILPREELLGRGYLPTEEMSSGGDLKTTHAMTLNQLPREFKNLAWPVHFQDDQHTMGNNMVQYQGYQGDLPYFHGGDDLRAQSGEWVIAPVSGKIEAGHYGYTTNNDGSMQKFMKPWPETGEPLYFEVGIVTDDGYRFEFHHINRDSLTSEMVDKVVKGGRVNAGDRLGQVAVWPETSIDGSYYHHTHYNVIAPNGVRVNPEAISVRATGSLDDKTAPVIHAVYAISSSDQITVAKSGDAVPSGTQELIVAATDQRGSDIYTQAPSFVQLKFEDGSHSVWDFRTYLTTENGSFPNIHEVFKDEICVDRSALFSACVRTQGDYDGAYFLFRLQIPAQASGKFEIRVEDASGNSTTQIGSL